MPARRVAQAQALEGGEPQPRYALKDVRTGVGAKVGGAHLGDVGHGANTKAVEHDDHERSHGSSFLGI